MTIPQTHMTTPIALITSGSRGPGKSMVRSVTKRGTDVVFTYQSREADADETSTMELLKALADTANVSSQNAATSL